MYAVISSSSGNLANIQIARAGHIRSIRWAIGADMPADNASFAVECSLSPSSALASSDVFGPLDEVRVYANLTTSGAYNGGVNVQRILDMPVAAGERLYLNAAVSGTVSAVTACYIDVED